MTPRTQTSLVLGAAATLVAAVLWPALALASGSAGPGEEAGGSSPIPVNDMIEALVNFSIFAFVLVYFFRKPIADYLEKRSNSIAKQLDEAARLHEEAKAKLAQYEKRLEAFDKERDQLFENVRKEAEADRQQILADAKRQAARITADTEVAVAYEIKRAQRELRERIVDEAVDVARVVLREKLDKSTQDRLIKDYTAALSELKSERAG